jgi:hypothetical protein
MGAFLLPDSPNIYTDVGTNPATIDSATSALDNLAFGTLSDSQKQALNDQALAEINQAAAGNTELASSAYQQYLSDVNAAVYAGLPKGVEYYLPQIEKWLPWIAGGLLLAYLLPSISRLAR